MAATPEQAKAFSERAAAHILEVGEAKAFADFTRRDNMFHDGELYVFCYDSMGLNMAHGGNPAFVGRNLQGSGWRRAKSADRQKRVRGGTRLG